MCVDENSKDKGPYRKPSEPPKIETQCSWWRNVKSHDNKSGSVEQETVNSMADCIDKLVDRGIPWGQIKVTLSETLTDSQTLVLGAVWWREANSQKKDEL
jgi:hypothetical protein